MFDFSHILTKIFSWSAGSSKALLCLSLLGSLSYQDDLQAQNSNSKAKAPQGKYSKLNRSAPVIRDLNLESPEAATNESSRAQLSSGQVYPLPALETVTTFRNPDGSYRLAKAPRLSNTFLDRRAAKNQDGDFVFFTLDEKLQSYAEKLIRENHAPHVALVAMDPSTGHILALAEKSSTIADLSLHAGFPAASLFKVVTTAAAIDSGRVSPSAQVNFRGGTYELSQSNYLPNSKKDKRSMSLGEALGKSCNPVFGRVALNSLSASILDRYGKAFGFARKVPFDLDLPQSSMDIPASGYALSRTAAGFGEVRISPLHAATLMAGLANGGLAKRPILVDRIVSPSGQIKHRAEPESWLRIVPEETADKLMNLMVNTTTVGTSRKEFFPNKKSILGKIKVAGKTGTLSGTNPVGLNNWFIGAPVDLPTIAVAAIVVDPGGISSKASRMGRLMIQKSLELATEKSNELSPKKAKKK